MKAPDLGCRGFGERVAISGRLAYLRAAHVISNATPMIRLADRCGIGISETSWKGAQARDATANVS
jgi:hypothetical protein